MVCKENIAPILQNKFVGGGAKFNVIQFYKDSYKNLRNYTIIYIALNFFKLDAK